MVVCVLNRHNDSHVAIEKIVTVVIAGDENRLTLIVDIICPGFRVDKSFTLKYLLNTFVYYLNTQGAPFNCTKILNSL